MTLRNPGRTAIALVAGCLLAGGASTLLAHHSQAAFDVDSRVTIEGTVTRVSWANPHSLIFLDATLQGQSEMESWTVEGPAPAQLENANWHRDTVQVGDIIVVDGNPSRSGRPFMLLTGATMADGERFTFGEYGNVSREAQERERARQAEATRGALTE